MIAAQARSDATVFPPFHLASPRLASPCFILYLTLRDGGRRRRRRRGRGRKAMGSCRLHSVYRRIGASVHRRHKSWTGDVETASRRRRQWEHLKLGGVAFQHPPYPRRTTCFPLAVDIIIHSRCHHPSAPRRIRGQTPQRRVWAPSKLWQVLSSSGRPWHVELYGAHHTSSTQH